MPRRSPISARRTLVRGAVSSLAVAGLTSIGLATAGSAVASQPNHARNSGFSRFVLTVTSSNRHGDSAYINNPATNRKPRALLFVTPNWNPNNTTHGIYDQHPIGVVYSRDRSKWGIFNEDLAGMPLGAAFIARERMHGRLDSAPGPRHGTASWPVPSA